MFTEVLSKVFSIVGTKSVKGMEKEVFDLAVKEGLTVYDASYVLTAMKNKLTLVTDDQKLASKASKYVKCITTKELLTKHSATNY